MPIFLGTFITRSNPTTVPFVVQDIDLRGGFRVVADHDERNDISNLARVPGMLVLTKDDGIIWQLLDGNTDWVEFQVGGGGGAVQTASDPLSIDVSGDLSINADRILPAGGNAGEIPVRQSGGGVAWEPNSASGSVGVRSTVTKTDIPSLIVGESNNFTLAMSRSCMLIDVEVNSPDLMVQCFSTVARDDVNPYTFISDTGRLSDVGISELQDESLQYNRRYAFAVNRETPTTTDLYWTITNQGSVSITPVITITYLPLE